MVEIRWTEQGMEISRRGLWELDRCVRSKKRRADWGVAGKREREGYHPESDRRTNAPYLARLLGEGEQEKKSLRWWRGRAVEGCWKEEQIGGLQGRERWRDVGNYQIRNMRSFCFVNAIPQTHLLYSFQTSHFFQSTSQFSHFQSLYINRSEPFFTSFRDGSSHNLLIKVLLSVSASSIIIHWYGGSRRGLKFGQTKALDDLDPWCPCKIKGEALRHARFYIGI